MQLQGRAAVCNPPVWADWSDRLPQRPLCGDILADGTLRRPRTAALSYQHVEFNSPGRLAWLNFDIDRADSFECWERAHLPVPNAYAQNLANGHGHVLYALRTPVGLLGLSRGQPMALAADIQRGMTRRVGADPAYANRLAKNPNSKRWRSSWFAAKPYELADLLEALDRCDLRKPDSRTATSGISRNCDLFNELRQFAYANVLKAKRCGSSFKDWRDRLYAVARGINLGFGIPLPHAELRQIAKSVARWTWRRFSEDGFSQVQSHRASIGNRQRGKQTLAAIEQVTGVGVSLIPRLYPDMADVLPVSRGRA